MVRGLGGYRKRRELAAHILLCPRSRLLSLIPGQQWPRLVDLDGPCGSRECWLAQLATRHQEGRQESKAGFPAWSPPQPGAILTPALTGTVWNPGHQLSREGGTWLSKGPWCPHLKDRNDHTVPHRLSREGPRNEIGDLKERCGVLCEVKMLGTQTAALSTVHARVCVCVCGGACGEPCAFVPKLLVQAPTHEGPICCTAWALLPCCPLPSLPPPSLAPAQSLSPSKLLHARNAPALGPCIHCSLPSMCLLSLLLCFRVNATSSRKPPPRPHS